MASIALNLTGGAALPSAADRAAPWRSKTVGEQRGTRRLVEYEAARKPWYQPYVAAVTKKHRAWAGLIGTRSHASTSPIYLGRLDLRLIGFSCVAVLPRFGGPSSDGPNVT